MTLRAGPYEMMPVADGYEAPFYALRFDKSGRSEGPGTQDHLIRTVAAGAHTDVYLFSHGWNTDWKSALRRYRDFVATFRKLINRHGLSIGRDYRPLLAGVFWPSAALIMPWESNGPEFAGSDGELLADDVDLALVSELAADIDPEHRDRFYRLLEQEALTWEEGRELAALTSSVYKAGDPDLVGDDGRDAEDLRASWAMLEAQLSTAEPLPAGPADFGAADSLHSGTAPDAASFLNNLNPRDLVRLLTVYQMKDRAGVVGSNGVGPLLREMLVASPRQTRYHLTGHSYGARVLLNAIARPSGGGLPRTVNSLLLLQPAVNHLCFSRRLPNGKEGGYRRALGLVEQPILSTFSVHDFPLRTAFHLALRRGKDLGEAQIAADEPPNQYAALGGYGPGGDVKWGNVPIKDPTDEYDLGPAAPEVWAVNGGRTISSHGDVVNESTAWALFNLVKG